MTGLFPFRFLHHRVPPPPPPPTIALSSVKQTPTLYHFRIHPCSLSSRHQGLLSLHTQRAKLEKKKSGKKERRKKGKRRSRPDPLSRAAPRFVIWLNGGHPVGGSEEEKTLRRACVVMGHGRDSFTLFLVFCCSEEGQKRKSESSSLFHALILSRYLSCGYLFISGSERG